MSQAIDLSPQRPLIGKPKVAIIYIISARFCDLMLWIGCLAVGHFVFQALFPNALIWLRILLLNSYGLALFGGFFVLIPTVWNGQTLGRWLFKIQVCKAHTFQKLSWRFFLLREAYIVLTPVAFTAVLLIISTFLSPNYLPFLWRLSSLNIFWFGFLFLFQHINPNQQIFVDRWYNAWIIHRSPITTKATPRFQNTSSARSNKNK